MISSCSARALFSSSTSSLREEPDRPPPAIYVEARRVAAPATCCSSPRRPRSPVRLRDRGARESARSAATGTTELGHTGATCMSLLAARDVLALGAGRLARLAPLRGAASRRGRRARIELRFDLVRLLEQRGLYQGLSECLDEALLDARNAGLDEEAIDDVLMVAFRCCPAVTALREEVRPRAGARVAAVRGGGVRRDHLCSRPRRTGRFHRPRLRAPHPRCKDAGRAASGGGPARHAHPHRR